MISSKAAEPETAERIRATDAAVLSLAAPGSAIPLGSAWNAAVPDAIAEGTSADAAAAAILENVPAAMRAIRARMRAGRPPGISVAQFRALLYVRRNPGSGLSDLAEHLSTSVPAASELVSRLVRQDLLVRETNPAERRRIRLTLSPGGAGQLEDARRGAVGWLRGRVSGLDHERQRALVVALADLRSLVEPPPGPADGDAVAEPTRAT
ncbi:MAG: MarR family winged helix-turn-helix transcriptional regulator [Candidatus Limnocylindrales bacterium]